MDFRYFSSVEGRAFRRPVADALLGCTIKIERNKDGIVTSRKHVWDTKKVVAVPVSEIIADLKTWTKAIKAGDITEVDEETAKKSVKAAEKAVEKAAKEAKAAAEAKAAEAKAAEAEKAAKAAAKAKPDAASAPAES